MESSSEGKPVLDCSVPRAAAGAEDSTVHRNATTLISLAGDPKYAQIDALRKQMRCDVRFTWADLPLRAGCGLTQRVFVRQKNTTTSADRPSGDKQLEALLEADSIPQYVWPAAAPLQMWIVAHADVFTGKTVLELGCGTGIIGFTVAQYAKLVVLTDCSAVALAMVMETMGRSEVRNCRVAALSWGREDQMRRIKEACGIDAFDVVIGSDVFYFGSALRSGLATARSAFAPQNSSDAIVVCGSVARSERMESDLEQVPSQEGFVQTEFLCEEPFQLYCWKLSS